MSSTTADTYPESVGSCPLPTPPTSPPPHPAPAAAPRGAPVRRQLDFADADADAGAGGDLDDYVDGFILRAVDEIERGYNEAKRRAPPCVCGRGDCAVQRDDQRGGWMYVCSSQPKCKHVAMCKEVDQNPQSPPVVRSHPKPSNRCVFNVPRSPVDDARTRINNVNSQGAGVTTPINVSPQVVVATTPLKYTSKGVGAMTLVHVSPLGGGATTPVHVSPLGAGVTTPVHVSPLGAGATTPVHVSPLGAGATTPVHVSPLGAGATTPVHVSPLGAGAMTPVHVSPLGAGATTPVHVSALGGGTKIPVYVSPQGAGATAVVKVSARWDRFKNGQPICQCTAGKCKISRVGNEDCYVCPITKGQGACSYKVPVKDVKGPTQIGDYKIKEAVGNNAGRVRANNANESVNPSQPNDDEWPFDVINNEIVLTGQATLYAVVHQESPSTPRQTTAMARRPATSPGTPFASRSPMMPRPNDVCRGCGEKGHWVSACPKPSSRNRCFRCGMVGHWQANCPQPRGPQKQA